MLLAVCCGLTDWLLENFHSARAGGGLRFFFFWCWYNNILDPSSCILSRRAVEAHLEREEDAIAPREKPSPQELRVRRFFCRGPGILRDWGLDLNTSLQHSIIKLANLACPGSPMGGTAGVSFEQGLGLTTDIS